jgi:archaellum component FlaD/FlaE
MLRCVILELRGRPIAFQRSDDEEEENGEEERRVEEETNVEEGPNEEKDEGEEEAEVERVMRQTQRSHMAAPPIAPVWKDDRVLIKPLGDK